MSFSISLLLVLVTKAFSQTSSSALTAAHPYRIGQKSLQTTDLTTNGTYLVNFDPAYASPIELMPPLLCLSNMDFLNTGSNKIFFSLDPNNFNPNDNVKFSIEIKLGPVNSYYTKLRVKYFVSKTNDKVILPIYIYTNQKQLILNDAANQLKIYNQDLFGPAPACSTFLQCLLGPIISLVSQITSLIGLPLVDGIGKALSDDSYSPYTVIDVKTFFNRMDFTYSGPWSFGVQSKSTNISNLSFNLTISNTITGTPKYNFSALIRNTSYSLAALDFKLDYGTLSTYIESSWARTPDRLSSYLLFGLSSIQMLSSNTNKRIDFLIQPTSSLLLEYTSSITQNYYVFPVLGFFFTKCSNSPYLKIMFQSQLCYDTCPTTYYSNVSNYCVKCVSPCLACSSQVYCTTCLPALKLVPSSGSCIPCATGSYFHDTLLTCQACKAGCTSCDNYTHCTGCSIPSKLILSGHDCVSCQSTEYFKATPAPTCESCPVGCSSCSSATQCLSCEVSMKLVLASDQCVSCPNSKYFNYDSVSGTSTCQNCPTGCTTCDNTTHCLSCSSPMQLVLVNHQCVSCPSTQYYSQGTSTCQDCPTGCTSCLNQSVCQTCNASLSFYFQTDYCYQCNFVSKYFNLLTQTCETCSEGCLKCNSFSNCSTCDYSLKYQHRSLQCYQCVPPTIFTRANKCEYVYQQVVFLNQEINTLRVCSKFNISENDTVNTEMLAQDYSISLFIDSQPKSYANLTIHSQAKLICFDYEIISSFTNQRLDVIYHNTSNTDRILNPYFVHTASGSRIHTFEETIYDVVKGVVDVLVDNSGVAAPILLLSSAISFFMGFIEFAQITSLYIFTQAPIPYNLKVFLETIIQAQRFPLLPFSIPNPMANNPLKVPQKQIFSQYQTDQYFLRGSLITIVQVAIYLTLYAILCFSLHFVKSKNLFARFFYKQFVSRCYSNCALALEVVQIILVFSAAVAIGSRGFGNVQLMMNSVTGMAFALLVFVFIIVSIVYLFRLKAYRVIDTEDIYPAIERIRKGSEMYTFLRLTCLLSIALLLPLIHYLYVVSMALCLLTAQMWYLHNKNVHKFRVQNWLRIIHTLLFMLFNFIYIGYFIIDRYFKHMDIDIVLRIGNVSMISLLCIYVCDLLLAVIDIGDKVIEKFMNVFCKKKLIECKIEEKNSVYGVKNGQRDLPYRVNDFARVSLDSNKAGDISKIAFDKKTVKRIRRSEASRISRRDSKTRKSEVLSILNRQNIPILKPIRNSLQYPQFQSLALPLEDPNFYKDSKSQARKSRKNSQMYKARFSDNTNGLSERIRKQKPVIEQQGQLEQDDVEFPTTNRRGRQRQSKIQ